MWLRKRECGRGIGSDKVKTAPPREHKIAFAIGLAILIYLALGPFMFPWFFEDNISPFISLLIRKIPFGEKIGIGWLFVLPILAGLIVYSMVRYYLQASRQFQSAVVALIVVAIFLACLLYEKRSSLDWTARGLNPDRPGFKPQVVILSGTFTYKANDSPDNLVRSGEAFFEIRMRGSDYYYCRKWNHAESGVGSWFDVELAIPGFASHWGLSRGRFGTRGGGGSWYGAPEDLMPARRLWNGTNLIGAITNYLEVEDVRRGAKEEFQKLKQIGSWQIPRRILFSRNTRREEIYTIKKVEFWNRPATNWYWDVKAKYFDTSSQQRTNDLQEPGPNLGR